MYQNDREGFRFLVPEGWSQYARAEVPPGKVTKERLLVQYRRLVGGKGAILEVTLDDLAPATDLTSYLSGPGHGANKWHPAGPLEKRDVNEHAATRFTFQSQLDGALTIKEVVAFRRDQRVYFFTCLYAATDVSSREQFAKTVASIIWKN